MSFKFRTKVRLSEMKENRMGAKKRWGASGQQLKNPPVTQLPDPSWRRDIYFLELVFLDAYFSRDFPLN